MKRQTRLWLPRMDWPSSTCSASGIVYTRIFETLIALLSFNRLTMFPCQILNMVTIYLEWKYRLTGGWTVKSQALKTGSKQKILNHMYSDYVITTTAIIIRFVTGVVSQEKAAGFERMLWRAGKALCSILFFFNIKLILDWNFLRSWKYLLAYCPFARTPQGSSHRNEIVNQKTTETLFCAK